jgi:hypothetical protein
MLIVFKDERKFPPQKHTTKTVENDSNFTRSTEIVQVSRRTTGPHANPLNLKGTLRKAKCGRYAEHTTERCGNVLSSPSLSDP